MTLLAVDPGADAGWARFSDSGKLVGCGLNHPAMTQGITRCVIERPVIYPGSRGKARPNDILTLALRAGEWAGRVGVDSGITPEYIEPRKWKGTIDGDICNARVFATLTDGEKDILVTAGKSVAPSKRHNIIDAVGIGLWACKRYR